MFLNFLLLAAYFHGLNQMWRFTDARCCLLSVLPSAAGMMLVCRLGVPPIPGGMVVIGLILLAMLKRDCRIAQTAWLERNGAAAGEEPGQEDCDR